MAALNVPNVLTLFRMVMVPVFVGFVAYRDFEAALFAFLAAGVTDALDGFIARHWNLRTALGAILDPIADKFLLVSAFLALALGSGPVAVPLWLGCVVIGRDVVLLLSSTALWLHGSRKEFRPSILGKVTTVVQTLFVGFALLDNARGEKGALFDPLAWLTLAATLVSGLHYLHRSLSEQPTHPV